MYKEYFKEIFETSKSVIIPGLGSFSKSGPADPKVTFNPYLKFNDGFLAGFIARKQNISMDDAGKMIADNVDKINEALNQKGEALVLGLGILKKTADGKLEFITDISAGGNTPTPKPEIKPEEKPTVKPVDPPKPEVKPEIKPEPPKPEIKPEKKPEVKPIEPEKKESNVKVEAPALTNVQQPSAKDKNAKVPDNKAAKKVKPPKPPKPPRPEGEKKKKFPLVLVIVLVLLAGAGTFTAIKWDMVKGWLGMTEEKELAKKEEPKEEKQPEKVDTAAVTPVDTVATETVVEEPVTEEKTKPVKEKTKNNPPAQHNYSSSGSFHVIVNCFSMEQNANRMVEKLNAEGHQGNNLGLRGGFFMVEAGSFSTMDEAKSKLEAVRSVYPKAWIYAGS